MAYRIESIAVRPLSVPLIDPFTIASGRIEATRAALVEATVRDERAGGRATGLGEAAALPPVTHEDQPDPRPMIMVLMPSTSPRRLTRGPPELPGLMLASVWR